MRTIAVLQTMREILSPAGAWCRGAYALAADGRQVHECHSEACAWCLTGAFGAAREEHGVGFGADIDKTALFRIAEAAGIECGRDVDILRIQGWNDDANRTQTDVLAIIDRAIAEERRRMMAGEEAV